MHRSYSFGAANAALLAVSLTLSTTTLAEEGASGQDIEEIVVTATRPRRTIAGGYRSQFRL